VRRRRTEGRSAGASGPPRPGGGRSGGGGFRPAFGGGCVEVVDGDVDRCPQELRRQTQHSGRDPGALLQLTQRRGKQGGVARLDVAAGGEQQADGAAVAEMQDAPGVVDHDSTACDVPRHRRPTGRVRCGVEGGQQRAQGFLFARMLVKVGVDEVMDVGPGRGHVRVPLTAGSGSRRWRTGARRCRARPWSCHPVPARSGPSGCRGGACGLPGQYPELSRPWAGQAHPAGLAGLIALGQSQGQGAAQRVGEGVGQVRWVEQTGLALGDLFGEPVVGRRRDD
jgi:hypothetical protein